MRKGKRKASGAAGVGFPGSEADYRSESYRVREGDDGPGVAPGGADAAVSRMHPPKRISNYEALLACSIGWVCFIGFDDAEDVDPADKGFAAGDRT